MFANAWVSRPYNASFYGTKLANEILSNIVIHNIAILACIVCLDIMRVKGTMLCDARVTTRTFNEYCNFITLTHTLQSFVPYDCLLRWVGGIILLLRVSFSSAVSRDSRPSPDSGAPLLMCARRTILQYLSRPLSSATLQLSHTHSSVLSPLHIHTYVCATHTHAHTHACVYQTDRIFLYMQISLYFYSISFLIFSYLQFYIAGCIDSFLLYRTSNPN